MPAGAIDTCGTGGDRSGTVNVSTMAALIAAGAGVRVVKHGNRAASSQCGSADVLEALGVAIELGPEGVARCVREAGVGFCLAPRYHPAMRFLGPARKELGVPTTFNFLGPLLNPARVKRQAIGVSDDTMASKMLGALHALGAERAMVFHGDDGLDELTTTTTSTVHELVDGDGARRSRSTRSTSASPAPTHDAARGRRRRRERARREGGARGREGRAPRHRRAERGGRARRRGRGARSRRGGRGRGQRRSIPGGPRTRWRRWCA